MPPKEDVTHRLLLRQLKRIGVTGDTPDAAQWAELLERVSASYREAEQDRYMLERALSVSSGELQELNETRTRFFSHVSHELRTPLALILGPVESVLQGREPLSQDLLSAIATNARRLLKYVNALLDLAKIDSSHQMPLRVAAGNPGRLLEEVADAARPQARRREITIETEGTVSDCLLDYEKAETIVVNLLSNALKFTPDKGKIILKAAVDERTLRLTVRDTGPGIPAEHVEKIFDRFHQIEAAGTSRHKGTGLGLAIVRELVKLHEGDIEVKNADGGGAEFVVSLPFRPSDGSSTPFGTPLDQDRLKHYFEEQQVELVPVNTDEDRAEVERLNRAASENRKVTRSTLLCVEENPGLLKYTHGLLKDRYNVFIALNGKDALGKIKLYTPDLILSDLVMPEMDGIALCRAVRADPELEFVSYILLTAKSGMESRIEGLGAGADDFISKPLNEPELLARIENLLRLRQRQRRMKLDLKAAQAVQRAILPAEKHDLGGSELEALYCPSEELSGDFYEVIRLGDRVIFYLADVTQHGTASAQVTFLLKEIFLSAMESASGERRALQDILRRTGERYARYGLDYGIAIQAMEYNPKTRELEYLRGGAPAGVRVSKTEAAYLPGPSSFPLSKDFSGASQGGVEPFSATKVRLLPGEKIYFFTDGLFALCSGERIIGSRQVLKLLEDASTGDWKLSVTNALMEAKGRAVIEDDVSVLRLSIT